MKHHLAAIHKLHQLHGYQSVISAGQVELLLEGIARLKGKRQKQAPVFSRAELCAAINRLDLATPAGRCWVSLGPSGARSCAPSTRRLASLLTEEVRQHLDALLLPEAGCNLTRHRWLVQPATAGYPTAIATALDKLRYLDSLGVAAWDVSSLHPNRQKRLALLARSRSNRHLERLPAAKRYPVLVAFLRESYLGRAT